MAEETNSAAWLAETPSSGAGRGSAAQAPRRRTELLESDGSLSPAVRASRTTIKLDQPFNLRGCPQSLEAGVYLVDTEEQLIESLSFCAYQRTRTSIHLHRRHGRSGLDRVLRVSGDDLDTAVALSRAARDLAIRQRLAADDLADLSEMARADDDGMRLAAAAGR